VSDRHQAREVAVKVLFQLELQDGDWRTPMAYHLDELDLPKASRLFAEELVEGAVAHRSEIDTTLEAASSHWRIDQMGAPERAVLRLAVEELGWRRQDPVAVVINEAVELAKELGGADAGRFVNGVLGRVAQAVSVQS
jgi:N utilization substance protein B